MKINRYKLSKFFARFGLIIMAFVLMIPLCSAATPVSADDGTITLKAGTYRFNDVIDLTELPYDNDYFNVDANFTFPQIEVYNGIQFNFTHRGGSLYEMGYTIQGIDMVVWVFANGQESYEGATRFDNVWHTLTELGIPEGSTKYTAFTQDVEVDDTFGTWYITNTNYNEVNGIISTDSIFSAWTGIFNWITIALNTVQGLFITETFGNTVLPGTYTFNESFDGNFPDLDFSVDLSTYMLNYTYNGTSFDGLLASHLEAEGGGIVSSINSITFSDFGGSVEQTIYAYQIVNGSVSEENNGYLVDTPVEITISESKTVSPYIIQILSDYTDYDTINADADSGSSYQLTLLGTLAVIGVSISICFLIIGVIQRFLKLRG